MKRLRWLVPVALSLCAAARGQDPFNRAAATPGLATLSENTAANARAVVGLIPFDGRLYARLATAGESNLLTITSYDPVSGKEAEEQKTQAYAFGRFRVLQGALYVPVAEPAGKDGGFYVTAGTGRWAFVRVTDSPAGFLDAARAGNRTFLAGHQDGRAIVAWHDETGPAEWNRSDRADLTAQAARLSPRASRFLSVSNDLALLAGRDGGPDWPRELAPRDWGGWYLLHYCPTGSVRGFLFDGPARPLPSLRLLAPGSQFVGNPNYGIAGDAPWRDGLLYVVLQNDEMLKDPATGLFAAFPRDNGPQVGRSLAASPVKGMGKARAVATENGACYVLLSEPAEPIAMIMKSTDLEKWDLLFEGSLPDSPLSLAVLDGNCYLGLANGSILKLKRTP